MPNDPCDAGVALDCFFITPIGASGSAERQRSDGVLAAIVEPAAAAVGASVVRADKIAEGGHVTLQVLEQCATTALAVADLTGGNLNVYYEVGLRHALRLPVALLAEEGAVLPFDLLQQRTVFYTNDLYGAASCTRALIDQLRRGLEGHVDSPVNAALNRRTLESGDLVHQTLAELVRSVEALEQVARPRVLRRYVPFKLALELAARTRELGELAIAQTDPELERIIRSLGPLVDNVLAYAGPREGHPGRDADTNIPYPERRVVPIEIDLDDPAASRWEHEDRGTQTFVLTAERAVTRGAVPQNEFPIVPRQRAPAIRSKIGDVPYGYRHAKDGLEVDSESAERVRRVFRLVRDGTSIRQVAAIMTDETSTLWTPAVLELILRRDEYKRMKPGRIVDPRLWNAVQTKLPTRTRASPSRMT